MVGDTGIEPVTSAVSRQRSTAELIARFGSIEPVPLQDGQVDQQVTSGARYDVNVVLSR